VLNVGMNQMYKCILDLNDFEFIICKMNIRSSIKEMIDKY